MPRLRPLQQQTLGFTLIELLVSIAILSILVMIVLFNAPHYIAEGNDASRKNDLAAYQIAFEHYYEDYHCYPDRALLQECNSTTTVLKPYLQKILCDPSTHTPYQYETLGSATCASAYRMFTVLTDATDKSIAAVGCTGGCGPSGTKTYNYGVASTNTILNAGSIGQSGGGGTNNQNQSSPTNCYTLPCTCVPGTCGSGCEGHLRCSQDSTYCYPDPATCGN